MIFIFDTFIIKCSVTADLILVCTGHLRSDQFIVSALNVELTETSDRYDSVGFYGLKKSPPFEKLQLDKNHAFLRKCQKYENTLFFNCKVTD